jgi:hypothetical protein
MPQSIEIEGDRFLSFPYRVKVAATERACVSFTEMRFGVACYPMTIWANPASWKKGKLADVFLAH